MDRAASIISAGPGSTEHWLGLWHPCYSQPLGRQSSPLRWVGVLYAMSTAARESLPVWLFTGVPHGGMGVEPSLIGVVFASGILMAEVGRAVSIAGWHGASFRLGGWATLPEEGFGRVLYVARARVVTVAALGLLYLLSRLLPVFGGPSVLVIFGGIATVAVNRIIVDLCKSLLMHPSAHDCVGNVGAAEGHEEEKQRATNSTAEIALASGAGTTGRGGAFPMMAFTNGSIVAGDVVASSIGPLLLALALSTGWPSPLDSSWWFVLCLTGDLWILFVSRETGVRHARLPEGNGAVDEEGRSTIGFPQFV